MNPHISAEFKHSVIKTSTLHSFRYRIIWWSGWWYRFSAIPHLWTSFLQGWSISSSVS